MSSKKKFQPEIKQEDLTSITNLRNKINNLLNSESDAKKAAQVLNLWLQEKEKTKK